MDDYHLTLERLVDSSRPGGPRQIAGAVLRSTVGGRGVRFLAPMPSTIEVKFGEVVTEMCWTLTGSTNANTLSEDGVRRWDHLATWDECSCFGRRQGDLGPVDGAQWRRAGAGRTDQLRQLLTSIRERPRAPDKIACLWPIDDLGAVSELPRFLTFQAVVVSGPDGPLLDLIVHQREADWIEDVPRDRTMCAVFLAMLSRATGVRAGDLVHTFGQVKLRRLDVAEKMLDEARTASQSRFDPVEFIVAHEFDLLKPDRRLIRLTSPYQPTPRDLSAPERA